MSASSLGFSDWFESFETFRQEILAKKPLFMAPRPELAARVMSALRVNSLDDIFALRGAKTYAWFQKRNGERAGPTIPASSARRFYEAGMAIYVRRVREFESFEREIAESLRVPRISVECTFFGNPKDAMTKAHFDRSDIVILQIRGRKTWRIAPSTFAPFPLDSWGLLAPVTPDHRLYESGLPPTAMPEGTSYELEPGSLLFVPRGYWHETISHEDALSLHITVESTTRIDVMMDALKNELARDPWWREAAYDLSAGEPSSIELAAAACAALRDAASRIDARDLVKQRVPKVPVESDAQFERCAQVSFGIDTLDPRTDTARVNVTSFAYRERKATQLDMSIGFLPACEWISALVTGTAFSLQELLRAAPGLDEGEAKELLGLLETARLVRRA